MKGVSVIVCCYNSEKRLPETLKYLALQRVQEDFSWELIIVNNNSSDSTATLAESLWKKYQSPAPLNILDEQTPGLYFARERGLKAAKYDIILWCDDDNWLCENYIQTAFTIMQKDTEIGALGGWCEAAFEGDKPAWFDTYAKYFAVSRQAKHSGDITHKKGCVYGAGMVIRKSNDHTLKSLGFTNVLTGRTGIKLSSGEDTEYCYALRLIGKKIWFDERLYFQHFMTKGRLSLGYVSRIRKAMSFSNFVLMPYLDVLNGTLKTRKDFIKMAMKGMPSIAIKKIGALIIGSYEQRETAKEYFRRLRYRWFKYNTYNKTLLKIKAWVPNTR